MRCRAETVNEAFISPKAAEKHDRVWESDTFARNIDFPSTSFHRLRNNAHTQTKAEYYVFYYTAIYVCGQGDFVNFITI